MLHFFCHALGIPVHHNLDKKWMTQSLGLFSFALNLNMKSLYPKQDYLKPIYVICYHNFIVLVYGFIKTNQLQFDINWKKHTFWKWKSVISFWKQTLHIMTEYERTCTLYTGWAAESCLYMATSKTSDIRCVLRRCVTSWCTLKSEDFTHILASIQSYSLSVGRKIGLPGLFPGSWLSCFNQADILFKSKHSDELVKSQQSNSHTWMAIGTIWFSLLLYSRQMGAVK